MKKGFVFSVFILFGFLACGTGRVGDATGIPDVFDANIVVGVENPNAGPVYEVLIRTNMGKEIKSQNTNFVWNIDEGTTPYLSTGGTLKYSVLIVDNTRGGLVCYRKDDSFLPADLIASPDCETNGVANTSDYDNCICK